MQNNEFGGRGMIKSPLANKLKELRTKNNLSTVVLSEQFSCSSTHIYYLENDKRGVSDDLLTKYSEFFHVSFEELKELQKNSELAVKNYVEEKPGDINAIDELIAMITALKEPLRGKFIAECKENLQGLYYSFLVSYGLNDLKRCLTTLRNCWYSSDETLLYEEKFEGNLKLPEYELYFRLSVTESMCCLELLYEDQRKIEHFTKWLTQPDCSLANHSKIPHLEDVQKMKTFYWFSPKHTDNDHFLYLKEHHEDLTQLYIQSYKLDLLVKNYLKTDERAS